LEWRKLNLKANQSPVDGWELPLCHFWPHAPKKANRNNDEKVVLIEIAVLRM
jgi:hypothetical protein